MDQFSKAEHEYLYHGGCQTEDTRYSELEEESAELRERVQSLEIENEELKAQIDHLQSQLDLEK